MVLALSRLLGTVSWRRNPRTQILGNYSVDLNLIIMMDHKVMRLFAGRAWVGEDV